eukprot:CAMPEP_0168600144 /NCGR_PEP_ID=MMETSP0420-20121227/12576_1 /TAXON_ID=498008 /ORGANISM="Pessonella sp." /LENGTH=501 /DNA_ID=CAMNT_0008638113 /DNA_START=233 /DNA_END=1739 /DNA_ORIENTATION=-
MGEFANSIPAAEGHHIAEGRWLRNETWLNEYERFWFVAPVDIRAYSTWPATASVRRAAVTGNFSMPLSLLEAFDANFEAWVRDNWSYKYNCFWQDDGQDAMEDSISGNGCRPTINSILFSEAKSIVAIAQVARNYLLVAKYNVWMEKLRTVVLATLWNDEPTVSFFTVLKVPKPRPKTARHVSPTRADFDGHGRLIRIDENETNNQSALRCPPDWRDGKLVTVRELLGFTPWYYEVPVKGNETTSGVSSQVAARAFGATLWRASGFDAKWGPTTAERRAPCYNYTVPNHHECTWNGPTWPFATSRLARSVANVLQLYSPSVGDNALLAKADFLRLLRQYARLHTQGFAVNGSSPWIGEDAHPDLGYWLARQIMYNWHEKLRNRGFLYNHSTYVDWIMRGLVGIVPHAGSLLRVLPLATSPFDKKNDKSKSPSDGHQVEPLKYFAVDGVPYHGHILTVFFDSDGSRYGQGAGLHVWCNGKEIGWREQLPELDDALIVDLKNC